MRDGTVSRGITLQAFRTMFAVITKLLFIINNITNNNSHYTFVSLFKQTNLFKSFKLYYNVSITLNILLAGFIQIHGKDV